MKTFFQKNKKFLIFSLLILIFLEIFLFNFNSFRLFLGNYSYKKYLPEDIKMNNIVHLTETNNYIAFDNNSYFEIENIKTEIATLYINISKSKDFKISNVFPMQLYYTDENSDEYRCLPTKNVVQNIEKSKYLTCYFCGKSEKVRINFNFQAYEDPLTVDGTPVFISNVVDDKNSDYTFYPFKIDSIEINKPVPFDFNIFRLFLLFGIILFIKITFNYLNTNVYKNNSMTPFAKNIFTYTIIIAIYVLLFINILHIFNPDNDFYSTYYVDAILNGDLNLHIPKSNHLVTLNNPYDLSERLMVENDLSNKARENIYKLIENYQQESSLEKRISYEESIKIALNNFYLDNSVFLWDAVYYDNEYFVYFSILPILLFYLPFKLISGLYLSHSIVVFLCGAIVIFILYKILDLLCKMYFPNISISMFLYALLFLICGSGIFILSSRQLFYESCMITGIMFGLLGFYMTLKLQNVIKKPLYETLYFFLGALFFALAVACRPSYLIYSILFIPVLYKYFLKKDALINKKKFFINIIAVSIPYLVIGCTMMFLNYIRYGNVFEFGYNYQLTAIDNSNLHYKWVFLPTIFFRYLFALPHLKNSFPFFELQYYEDLRVFGYFYYEGVFAGIFFLQPICLFLLKIKNIFKESANIQKLLKCLLITAFCVIIASAWQAGINIRYFADFSWILVFASVIIMLSLYSDKKTFLEKTNFKKYILLILLVTLFITFVVQGLVGEVNCTKNTKPQAYYNIQYFINFWE